METKSKKKSKNSTSRNRLPTLNHSRSPNSILNATSPSSSRRSPQKLQGLRKLYYRYRSNANILQSSPYYTNRTQQKEVVAYIKAHKHVLTQQQKESIIKQYSLNQDQLQIIAGREAVKVGIELHNQWNTKLVEISPRSIGQLDSMLKIEHALLQLSAEGHTHSTDRIIGFETQDGHPIIDYLLSRKEEPIMAGQYQLRPIFSTLPKQNVRLQNFKLVRCLGSGGFSLVFLVRDNWNSDYYALKLINKKFILEGERQAIIENERFVLGEFKSPFVTSLKYCFETVNHFAFAIEYCPGGELFNQLRKVKRMTQSQAKFYFLEILIGLDYIHKKGVIYRDLKPQNLLISADGHVKIADFGLAKPLTQPSKQKAYSFCGSPQYMAPQMLSKKGHSFTLDYYCLGALLYELVFGIPPYYSLDHNEIYKGILQDELSFPDHTTITPQLYNLLQRLLEKNPAKRLGQMYGIQQILIHPWIGKISKQSILDKQLTPPFVPDLYAFNFDESDLKAKVEEMIPAIELDLQTQSFSTVFNRQFYYEAEGLVKRKKEKRLSINRLNRDRKNGHSSNLKENIRKRSVPKKGNLTRVQSQILRPR